MDKPKHYSPNKEYDLYNAYTEAESLQKTIWEEKSKEEKLNYLKGLQDEGFKPIHERAAMQQSVGEFKAKYDEEVNENTLNDIPFAKNLRSPESTPPKRGPNGAREKAPPVKRDINVRKPEDKLYKDALKTVTELFIKVNEIRKSKGEKPQVKMAMVNQKQFDESEEIK